MTSIASTHRHCPGCYSPYSEEFEHTVTTNPEPGITRAETYHRSVCTDCAWRGPAVLVDDTLHAGEQLALSLDGR